MLPFPVYIFIFAFSIYSLKKITNNTEIYIDQFLKGIVPSNNILILDDRLISVINDGKLYRWFLFAYSSNNKNSFVEKDILKLFNEYKKNENLRFAKIDISKNERTRNFLNISTTPYIILIENKSIFEFELKLNYKNLKHFLNINFDNIKNKTKIYPKELNIPFISHKPNFGKIYNIITEFLQKKFGFSNSTIKILVYIFLIGLITIFKNIFITFTEKCEKNTDKKIDEENLLKENRTDSFQINSEDTEDEGDVDEEEGENTLENDEEKETDDEDRE